MFANRAFLSMTGYSEAEVMGRNCRFLQGPESDPATVADLRSAIAARREITVELINYRKDGSTFWNALFVSPVFNHAHELVYCFASQLDVSRRREAEAALAQAQKMEALGQLTGGIAHDFNNLLQLMSGQVDSIGLHMASSSGDRAAVQRASNALREAVTRASSLTQQLLAFARKQSLKATVVDINAIVSLMRPLIESTLGDAIQFDFRLNAAHSRCELDKAQLEVALINLLVNARDAMPTGGHIDIATENVHVADEDVGAFEGLAPGDYVSLAVTDTGEGISQRLLGRVMEPFFTTKEEGMGTGLGLPSVYGFARQSGGIARIYSEEGIGTTVRMYFPAVAPAGEEVEQAQDAAPRGGTETMLVVDDRKDIADVACHLLAAFGYDAAVAYGGAQALEVAASLRGGLGPHLLLSDIVMPGINGYELAHAMCDCYPGLRVLMTTGYDRDLGRRFGDRPEEFEVIQKPYEVTQLLARIRGLLDGTPAVP